MDVAIVGGGLLGVALAVALRERNAKVTVFERGQLGGEASSAAGGILGAQTETDIAGDPLPLADLIAARSETLAFCAELEEAGCGATGVSREGVVKLAFDETELARLGELAAWQRASGARTETWTREELGQHLPAASPHALGALFLPDDAHLDPPRYFAAVCARARALDAQLEQGVNVRALGRDGDGAFVEHTIRRRFDRVVVAAGSWTSELLPDAPAIRPIRGHMLELRAVERPFGPVLFGAGAYSIPRADGRVTVGSTMEDVGHRRGVEAGAVCKLLAGALRSAPGLSAAELTRTWSQFRPYAPAGLQVCATATPNVFVLSGHHRNGILLARWSARRLAARVCA